MYMSNTKTKKLISKRSKLLKEIASLSSLLHGSWIERYSTCSRPDCKCHSGKRHGPRHYVVINVKGCQRQKYIPNAYVNEAKLGLAQCKRLHEIIDQITKINLALMKGNANENK